MLTVISTGLNADPENKKAAPGWDGLNRKYSVRSHMDDAVVGVQHTFVHHLAERRMREDGLHQILLGGFQLLGDFGFGIAEFPKGTEPNTVPITLAIHTGFPIQYRMGHFGIIGGVNPTTYIRGDLTFINLSGFFGLRFDLAKPTGGGGPFFTFAYTPRILNSLKQEGAVYPHTTLAFRIGASF